MGGRVLAEASGDAVGHVAAAQGGRAVEEALVGINGRTANAVA